MSKKKSSLCFILVMFYSCLCGNEKLPNPFGTPAAELQSLSFENEEMDIEDMSFDFQEDELYEVGIDETEKQELLFDVVSVKNELLFETTMLPKEGKTVTIMFDSSVQRHEKPRIIFEPTFFGNEGCVELAPLSRLVFSGDGIIEVRNGVTFSLESAQLILEKNATLHIVPDAAVTFINHKQIKYGANEQQEVVDESRQDSLSDQYEISLQESIQKVSNNFDQNNSGHLILREEGKILLDNPSHLIFGASQVDTITLKADTGGQFIIDNKNALVSFQQGTFDILFSNFSFLKILTGTMELNMCNGLPCPGFIRNLHFQTGAMLEVKNSDHGISSLALAANAKNEKVDFDNQTSFVRGKGNLCFKSFNNGDLFVHSNVQLQPHLFEQKGSMLDIFLRLACIDAFGAKKRERKVLLVQQGKSLHSTPGQLAAFAPTGDGSIVPLLLGDHKLVYDSNKPGGLLNVIRGYDAHNNVFVIDGEKRYS
ncbi:MAG: hypothetical protein WCD44_01115 [Candidatus Babeliales bacterium]